MNNYLGSLQYMNDLANNFGSGLSDEEIRNQSLLNQPEPILSGGVQGKISPLENFAMGMQDNYQNGFNTNNLRPMSLQDKPISNRLGEGFGTALRVIDSPLGRGLLSAGLTAALGGNASTVAKEGLSGFVGRQNAVAADKLYRNQLKQYGYTDDDLAQINGNITSDVYKNLATNMWRNKKLTSDEALKQMNWIRQMQLTGQIDNATADYYLKQIQSNIDFNYLNGFQDSNQTRKTDNDITFKQTRLKQIDKLLNIMQQRVNKMGVTSADKAYYNQLKAEKTELEIELYKQALGQENTTQTTQPRPVGQTTSKNTGLKLVGVRNK